MSVAPAPRPRDRTALAEVAASGAFERTASPLNYRLGSPDFPAEGGGRYVLYVSFACPWACRVLAALALKGLEREVVVSAGEGENCSALHSTW